MEERIFIGRTNAYYEPNDDSLYVEDTWTWSEDENDKDFVGDVYELNEDGAKELEWWLRCKRMNEYERNHSFNPDLRNQEKVWDSLITQATRIKMYDNWYEVNQVDATDGLDMVGKLQPMQVSRYFDKYVYRTGNGVAMACYVNDINNNWRI